MAVTNFDEARRAALMVDIVRSLRRMPRDLLAFDAVREKLRLRHTVDRGVYEVALDEIVGSLGRDREFNRVFLPRVESLRARWKKIRDVAEGMTGFPMVDLFKVGEAYFVVDGHHRVSVARALGTPTIEAHVREFLTEVPIGPNDSIEQLILRRGRIDFSEATGIEVGNVTEIDGYERLLDHISVHRYYLGLEQQRHIEWPEAVQSWREAVYEPMIAVIRDSGVLTEFPGRTETDLYLFAMDHLHYLRERYEDAHPRQAVEEMRESRSWSQRLRRFFRAIGSG